MLLRNDPVAREIASFIGRSVLLVGAVAYLLSFELPPGLMGQNYHVDLSSIAALNLYRHHGLEFGRDLLYSYGPLGYLLRPLAVGSNLVQSYVFFLIAHLTALVGIAVFLFRNGSFARAGLMFAALFSFAQTHNRIDNTLFPMIALIFYTEALKSPRSHLYLVPLLLGAVLLLAKFGIGLMLFLMFIVYLVFCRVINRCRWGAILRRFSLFVAATGAIAAFYFSSPANFFKHLWGSWAVGAGYFESLSLPGHPAELVAALYLMGVILSLAVPIARESSKPWAAYWSAQILIPLFFAFKHGFVRSDWHLSHFFHAAPVLAAAAALLLPVRRLFMAFLIVTVVACHAMAWRFYALSPLEYLLHLRLDNISAFRSVGKKNSQNAEDMRTHRLSAEEYASMKGHTVAVVPVDSVNASVADEIIWKPDPAFQHHDAMLAALDEENSRRIRDGTSADFVVFKWQATDGRHPIHPLPLTYFEMLNHYAFHSQTDPSRIILKKQAKNIYSKKRLGSAEGRFGENIEIPDSPNIVIAAIRPRLGPVGWLLKTLYRSPVCFTNLVDENGEGHTFRVSLATARNGIMVSRAPFSLQQARRLFEQDQVDPESLKMTAFNLEIPTGPMCYRPEFAVDFYELEIHAAGTDNAQK